MTVNPAAASRVDDLVGIAVVPVGFDVHVVLVDRLEFGACRLGRPQPVPDQRQFPAVVEHLAYFRQRHSRIDPMKRRGEHDPVESFVPRGPIARMSRFQRGRLWLGRRRPCGRRARRRGVRRPVRSSASRRYRCRHPPRGRGAHRAPARRRSTGRDSADERCRSFVPRHQMSWRARD